MGIETSELIMTYWVGYTEIQADKRNTYRNKVKAADKTAPNGESKSPQAANGDAEDDDTPPPAKKVRRSSVAGTNGDTESAQPSGAHSGDETISDEGDQEAEEAEESEEDAEDGAEEDVQVGDEPLEELDTQASIPPEDEALDNGDDSDW
jgi:DNA polymerase epsilon subunit 3